MKNDMEIRDFIEKKLDQIIAAGEWIGSRLGNFGRTTQKILIGVGVIAIFGVAAFLWAVGRGAIKKK